MYVIYMYNYMYNIYTQSARGAERGAPALRRRRGAEGLLHQKCEIRNCGEDRISKNKKVEKVPKR